MIDLKNFSPEATFAYAKLVNDFVQVEATEEFNKAFEDFLRAYENGGNDNDEIIHRDATPDEIADLVKNAFGEKREEPKAGEVYRDIFGEKYLVAAVNKTLPDEPVAMLIRMNKSGNPVDNAFITTLKDFMNPQFVKTA